MLWYSIYKGNECISKLFRCPPPINNCGFVRRATDREGKNRGMLKWKISKDESIFQHYEKRKYPKVENGWFTWCDYDVKTKYKHNGYSVVCLRVQCACVRCKVCCILKKQQTTMMTKKMKRDGRWFRMYI